MEYIMSLDQGTTSSRAIIFNSEGQIVSMAQEEFKQIYPQKGWVEHNPDDIYASLIGVMAQCLVRAKLSAKDISSVGITNQRETTIVWDRQTGKPIYNAIVWQCRRSAEYCESLKAQGYAQMIYDKTGLVLDSYFSATKIKWILDNVEGAKARALEGNLCFGTVDTYLMYNLTKGKIFATDYTNASRTMLFNIHTKEWDEELLKLFDIPKSMLPEVHSSSHIYGTIEEDILKGVPISGVVGDQQSALFGQLCTNKGDIKNTYGTGCFLLMNTGDKAVKSNNGLITTLGAGVEGEVPYVLEGSVFIGGAVVQWLRDEMGLINSSKESEDVALSVPDNGGVYVCPAFTGLGAPYWQPHARGTIMGITRGTRGAHIVRAALESIAFQVYDIARAMERDAGVEINALSVDGGASANNFLMSFQADILGANVVRPKVIETTALGAAYLAGLAVGVWSDISELKRKVCAERVFVPMMDEDKRQELLSGWAKIVQKTLL